MASEDTKDRRPKPLELAPEVIDQRLRDVAQLYRLGMALRDVRWLGKRQDRERARQGDDLAAGDSHE
jgi:hypothetical protein